MGNALFLAAAAGILFLVPAVAAAYVADRLRGDSAVPTLRATIYGAVFGAVLLTVL